MSLISEVSQLAWHGVAAFPPPGPLPSSFQFHHQGSNFAIFLILFALCMMEVVVLRIITEEQARGERGPRSVTSLWFELDDESEQRKRCLAQTADGICRRCGGDQQGGFLPCICSTQESVKFEKGAWFLRQVQRAVTLMPWSFSTDKLEQIEEECEGSDSTEGGAGRGDLRSVREFLEALSAKLAGGPIEGTRVAPLYDHPAYLPARNEQSISAAPSSGASSAHAQLKRLVARVVEEAAALPALARYAAEPPRTPPGDASTYEDLLATAILNKVIERYQNENGSGGRSSGIHSASASPTPSERSSPRSLNSRHNRDLTPPLHEEDEDENSDWEEGDATDDALELPRRVPFPEFGGDIIHSTDNEDRDFDEVSSSDIQAVDGTWEENWLFQKKKIKTLQSVPVPMLVPNSNTEYRAMIGDRDADDTTDLSDNASDTEEEQAAYKSDIKRVLDSKHVIGGKSKLDDIEIMDFEPDSLTILDDVKEFDEDEVDGKVTSVDTVNQNLISNFENENDSKLILDVNSGPLPKAEFSIKEEIHRTLNGHVEEDLNDSEQNEDVHPVVKNDYLKNREFTQNTLNGHEREGEYEETVTVPVQRYADSLRRKHFEDELQSIPTRDTDRDDIVPGSIADRERKKWLNYVEMPNNPYSPEAIQKRLSAKSASSLFDLITKGKDIDEIDEPKILKDSIKIKETVKTLDEVPVKEEIGKNKAELTINMNNDNVINGNRSKSPSPKILKDVLAEEVPQYKRYGRDYYIKEAKISSGGRKKSSFSDTSSLSSMNKSTSLDNFDTEFASTGLLIQQFHTIATNQQYNTFGGKAQPHQSITIISDSNNTQNILIEYEHASEQTLFSAKPVYVDDDTDKKLDEILQTAYSIEPSFETENRIEDASQKSPTNNSLDQSFLSTSSLEDSIKIYNVQTGEIVKCKPEDNVSQRYDPKSDSNANIDMPDKNSVEKSEEDVSHIDEVDDVSVIIEEKSLVEHKLGVIEEIEEITLPKVKELAKKFVSMDNLNEEVKPKLQPYRRRRSKDNILSLDKPMTKQSYMHSLTARSISREFREELKLSMATPLKVPGGVNEVPEGEEVTKESSRPGSPLPEPGTIKTKLAFFESLKNKFSK